MISPAIFGILNSRLEQCEELVAAAGITEFKFCTCLLVPDALHAVGANIVWGLPDDGQRSQDGNSPLLRIHLLPHCKLLQPRLHI